MVLREHHYTRVQAQPRQWPEATSYVPTSDQSRVVQQSIVFAYAIACVWFVWLALALSRGAQRRDAPPAPARCWAAPVCLTASYRVSGAISAPFGQTMVPPSMKNRWK